MKPKLTRYLVYRFGVPTTFKTLREARKYVEAIKAKWAPDKPPKMVIVKRIEEVVE